MAILDPFTGRPFDARATTPLTDEQRAQLLAAELSRKPAPMIVSIDPLTAYTTAKLLQIAITHPDISAEYAEPGRAVIDLVREYFADAPTVLEQLADAPDPDRGEVEDVVHLGGTDPATAGLSIGMTTRPAAAGDAEADLTDALGHVIEIFGRASGLPASRVARVLERALAARNFTAAIVPGHDA
jgi:hypothetical protein